jgi:hypothetical protein
MYSSWLNSAQSSTDYLKVYAYFALTAVLITLVASSLTVQVGLSGSQRLHNRMINALVHSFHSFTAILLFCYVQNLFFLSLFFHF